MLLAILYVALYCPELEEFQTDLRRSCAQPSRLIVPTIYHLSCRSIGRRIIVIGS
jgi:hypothetical protein